MSNPCVSPDIYKVHRLEKKRVREGKVEFWVKWRGWPARYNTWEPLDNLLDDCLIDDFLLREDTRLGIIKPQDDVAKDVDGSNCLEGTSNQAMKRPVNDQNINGKRKKKSGHRLRDRSPSVSLKSKNNRSKVKTSKVDQSVHEERINRKHPIEDQEDIAHCSSQS